MEGTSHPENLIDELLDCMNLSEMAKATIQGGGTGGRFNFPGVSGSPKSASKYRLPADFSSMYSRNTILKILLRSRRKFWKGNSKSSESFPNLKRSKARI